MDNEVVQRVVDGQDALLAGFRLFEEMIWKRINEQEDDESRAAVAQWIANELARVQGTVHKVDGVE